MREIKFRAWDNFNKCMWPVYGLEQNERNNVIAIKTEPQAERKDWVFGLKDIYPLMQYTGLKDKNGVEIHLKCDVLSCKSDDSFEHRDTIEIGWSIDDQYGFIWSTSRNIVLRQDLIDERYEVIGSIYENPELLEVKHG